MPFGQDRTDLSAFIKKQFQDGTLIVYTLTKQDFWPSDPEKKPLGGRGFWKGTLENHECIGVRKPDELNRPYKEAIIDNITEGHEKAERDVEKVIGPFG